ncbi:MAG: hypothetical protein AAF550_05920 [Myxococcota bacterium]
MPNYKIILIILASLVGLANLWSKTSLWSTFGSSSDSSADAPSDSSADAPSDSSAYAEEVHVMVETSEGTYLYHEIEFFLTSALSRGEVPDERAWLDVFFDGDRLFVEFDQLSEWAALLGGELNVYPLKRPFHDGFVAPQGRSAVFRDETIKEDTDTLGVSRVTERYVFTRPRLQLEDGAVYADTEESTASNCAEETCPDQPEGSTFTVSYSYVSNRASSDDLTDLVNCEFRPTKPFGRDGPDSSHWLEETLLISLDDLAQFFGATLRYESRDNSLRVQLPHALKQGKLPRALRALKRGKLRKRQ